MWNTERHELQVVIPVYNPVLQHFKEALQSLNHQTHRDFEVLFVDDGCTPPLDPEWIAGHLHRPFRIISMPQNGGVATALNAGLDAATAPFIARFDADDRMVPHRFATQVAFLKEHPEIGVCGSEAIRFGRRRNRFGVPLLHEDIAVAMLLMNPFCHPSVCFRSAHIRGHRYPLCKSEDTVFWAKLLSAGVRMQNLHEPLVHYRVEGQNVSVVSHTARALRRKETDKRVYEALFPDANRAAFLSGVRSGVQNGLGLIEDVAGLPKAQIEAHVDHIIELVETRPDVFPDPARVRDYLVQRQRIASSKFRSKWHKLMVRVAW